MSATIQVWPGERQRADVASELLEAISASTEAEADVVFDCEMSEEGGRFYQDINRYVMVVLPHNYTLAEEDKIWWLTLAEISELKRDSGVFTNEFRSMLSLLIEYL